MDGAEDLKANSVSCGVFMLLGPHDGFLFFSLSHGDRTHEKSPWNCPLLIVVEDSSAQQKAEPGSLQRGCL